MSQCKLFSGKDESTFKVLHVVEISVFILCLRKHRSWMCINCFDVHLTAWHLNTFIKYEYYIRILCTYVMCRKIIHFWHVNWVVCFTWHAMRMVCRVLMQPLSSWAALICFFSTGKILMYLLFTHTHTFTFILYCEQLERFLKS